MEPFEGPGIGALRQGTPGDHVTRPLPPRQGGEFFGTHPVVTAFEAVPVAKVGRDEGFGRPGDRNMVGEPLRPVGKAGRGVGAAGAVEGQIPQGPEAKRFRTRRADETSPWRGVLAAPEGQSLDVVDGHFREPAAMHKRAAECP
jgi:hypothetical protein